MQPDQVHCATDRFARHRLIQGFDQELISSLRIGLIGAGAIGNEVLKNFLLMGVGAVDVYDIDTVEESNLTRSVFLRSTDIGNNKAQAVVARAHELHPNTTLRAIAGDIFQTLSLSQTQQYDFLFCAVDNFEARLRINEIARITNLAWINCAIDSRNVIVEVYPPSTPAVADQSVSATAPRQQACYACGLPESSYERIAKRYSCGGLQRAAYLERTVPTTAITASIGAAIGVAEAFKLVREIKQEQQSSAVRIFIDTDLPNAQRMALSVNAQCPVCSEYGSVPSELSSTSGARINQRVIYKPAPSENANSQLQHWLEQLRLDNKTNDEPFDEPVVFSDAIITKAQCNHCPPSTSLSALIGLRAKFVTDDVMVCTQCRNETVQLEFLEICSISDLMEKTIALGTGQPAWLSCGQHYFDRIYLFSGQS
jgi:molybdopterin-synthase adenylyltransferase